MKIEKAKAVGIIVKIDEAIDVMRRNKKKIFAVLLVLALGAAFLVFGKNFGDTGTEYNLEGVLAKKSHIADNADQNGVVAEGDSIFAKLYSSIANSEAARFFKGDKQEHQSAILKVPAQFDTIQKAIDAAVAGDVVMVASGEYKEMIVMKDGVSVVGEKAETTILDGDRKGNVVTFKDVNNKKTRFENFSVKNAQENMGGILIDNSSPLINRNIIFSNDYDVFIKGHSSPVVQRNVLEQSKAGVQIFNLAAVQDSNPIITDNLIYANKKGVNLYQGNAIIEHNTISFNSTYGIDAGATFGIYLAGSSAVIRNNIITDNGTCEICTGVYANEASKDVQLSFNDIWNNQTNFVCFGTCQMEANNVASDPGFENGLLFDFNLKPDSPLLTVGSDGQKLGARL